MHKYSRFSDFANDDQWPLEGKRKSLDDILGHEILIIDFRIASSKYNDREYITIQFENGGVKHILFTGSNVLKQQLEKYHERLPFYTTIMKKGKYITLT